MDAGGSLGSRFDLRSRGVRRVASLLTMLAYGTGSTRLVIVGSLVNVHLVSVPGSLLSNLSSRGSACSVHSLAPETEGQQLASYVRQLWRSTQSSQCASDPELVGRFPAASREHADIWTLEREKVFLDDILSLRSIVRLLGNR